MNTEELKKVNMIINETWKHIKTFSNMVDAPDGKWTEQVKTLDELEHMADDEREIYKKIAARAASFALGVECDIHSLEQKEKDHFG